MLDKRSEAEIAESVSKTERAYESIRGRILDAAWLPGAPIDKVEVAKSLKLSTQPITSALSLLAEEGLVEIRPQRGSFVGRLSRARLMEASFIAMALANAAAGHLVRDEARFRAHEVELRSVLDGFGVLLAENAFGDLVRSHISYLVGLCRAAGLGAAVTELEAATRYQNWATQLVFSSPRFPAGGSFSGVRVILSACNDIYVGLHEAISRGDRPVAERAVAHMCSHAIGGFERVAANYPEYCDA